MLNTRVVQGITFITIENYDEYQFFVQQRNSVEYTTTSKSGTNISKEVNKRNKYTSNFNKLWELIPSKMRKSKGGAYKAFKSIKTKLTIEELGHRYQQHHRINKDYTKHPATWLNKECWLDDEVQNSTNEPTLIERMKKLGYAHRGSEDQYEQFSKDNKNYKIHRFKKDAVIEPD